MSDRGQTAAAQIERLRARDLEAVRAILEASDLHVDLAAELGARSRCLG